MRGSDSYIANPLDPHVPSSLRLDGLTILVVDDSFDNQLLFQRVLTGAGAQIEIARDGVQAVNLHGNGNFDVIIMDMMMPVMDGCEATRLIRKAGYKKPIIALTAHATLDAEARCRASGCSHFALKPIGRRELISVIHAAANPTY